jgi:hypothetical protein
MHWLSILAVVFVVLAVCQGQSDSLLNDARAGNSRAGFQVIADGNGADASGTKNGPDGSVQVSVGNVPSGSFMQHTPNGQNNMQFGNNRVESGRNDGQRNAGKTALLFFFPIFAALMYL